MGVDRRKPYVRIADDLRSQIASGHFPVGEPLPSNGDLAEKYGVAGMTVSNAIAVLREEGLVKTRQGTPAIVTATPDAKDAGEAHPEPSEEFALLNDQLKDIRTTLRRLSSRLDELDERTKDL